MDDELLSMLNEVIKVRPKGTTDGYGKITYGAPVTRNAYIERTSRRVRTDDDRIVILEMTIYVDGTSVNVTDEIELPDTTKRFIFSVDSYTDEAGAPHHQEIAIAQ